MDNKLLNSIATQIVADKVMDDKMKEYEDNQKKQEDDQKKKAEEKPADEEEDDDDIFAIDEEEEKIVNQMKENRLREQGIKPQARDRSREKKDKNSKYKYGEFREIDESEFLDTLLKNKKVVCHFYHQEFEKCKVMDKHLRQIAFDHPETLFVKINADKSPFFCTKLNIQVLPTVLLSNDGKVFDRVIGFEGLDGIEDFKTITLVRKLVLSKMIVAKNKTESGEVSLKKKTKLTNYDSEDSEGEY